MVFSLDNKALIPLTLTKSANVQQLWQGAIVVMDNLRVHHAESVRVAIESVGALIQVFATLLSRFITHRALLVQTQAIPPFL